MSSTCVGIISSILEIQWLRLLSLCTRETVPGNVQRICQLLEKAFNGSDDRRHIRGVTSAEVAEAIASGIQVLGWETMSSQVIALVRGYSAFTKGLAFVQLAEIDQLVSLHLCPAQLRRRMSIAIDGILFKTLSSSIILVRYLCSIDLGTCPPLSTRSLGTIRHRYEHCGK